MDFVQFQKYVILSYTTVNSSVINEIGDKFISLLFVVRFSH